MRRFYLIALVAALSLSACSAEFTPATMADLTRLERKVEAIPEAQLDAYRDAKEQGADDETASRAAFQAGHDKAQEEDVSSTGVLGSVLARLLLAISSGDWAGGLSTLLGPGAAVALTTVASRRRRGVNILTGKAPAEKEA